MAIYTMKGNTPLGRGQRALRIAMFENCVYNLGDPGTRQMAPYRLLGLEEVNEMSDPIV